MWGAAIGGVSSILGNWIGSRQNRKNVHDTNKANREMAEYSFGQNRKMAQWSYDKNLEQWHRQNEYNNPKAQMSRFKDAGLNPHLIYGQGSPGNATGSPQHSPAKHSPAKQDYTGRSNPVAMSLLDVAQARLLNAQAKQLETQSIKTGADTDNVQEHTKYQKIVNEYKRRMIGNESAILENQSALTAEQVDNLKLQNEALEQDKVRKKFEKELMEWKAQKSKFGLDETTSGILPVILSQMLESGANDSTIRWALQSANIGQELMKKLNLSAFIGKAKVSPQSRKPNLRKK